MSRLKRIQSQLATNRRAHEVIDRAQDLLRQSRPEEALDLLEDGLPRFGNQAAYRVLLATTYGLLGLAQQAAEQARAAAELEPKRADHHLLAALAYYSAGYFTLAHRARRSYARLVTPGETSPFDLRTPEDEYTADFEEVSARYGAPNNQTVEEASYQLDLGRWALNHGQWDDALRHSRRAAALMPKWPPPQNNAAVALYFMGRPAEAVAGAEGVLRECDPNNIQALSNLVRFHVAMGNAGHAATAGDQLLKLPLPDDPDSMVKLVEGLSLLDRDTEIDRIVAQLAKRGKELPATLHVYWGIAAANLGRRQEAMSHLRRAEELGEVGVLPAATLAALQQKQPGRGIAARYTYTLYTDWMPVGAFDQLIDAVQRDERSGKRDERRWTDLLHRYPQVTIALQKTLYEGTAGDAGRGVGPILDLLARLGSPAALDVLRVFGLGRVGEAKDRLQALHYLQQAGGLAPDETVEMWVDGELRLVQPMMLEISDDVTLDYPEKVLKAYEEALTAHREGRLQEAKRAYERMLTLAPNAKEAYNNLAVLAGADGDTVLADTYLDRALAIDPTYAYPRVTRALRALQDGNVQAAKDWLRPLGAIGKWQRAPFVSYQQAVARVALAESDYKQCRQHLEIALELVPDDPDLLKLLERVSLLEGFPDFSAWMAGMDTNYRKRRQQARLPADPTLADCFALFTRGDMIGIARTVNLGSVHRYKKNELRQLFLETYADPAFIAVLVSGLNPAERSALADVLDHNGVMNWRTFAGAHGDDLDERPHLEYNAEDRATVMGRLRARALLFEGTLAGELVVVIPRELRPLLVHLLGQS